jgi:hypothetical protein
VPRRPHAVWIRRADHGPQWVPTIALVDVLRDIDTVDRDTVDERVDVDVHDPRVSDRHIGQVHVAEARPAEIDAPEDGTAEIPTLEFSGHRAPLWSDASPELDAESSQAAVARNVTGTAALATGW